MNKRKYWYIKYIVFLSLFIVLLSVIVVPDYMERLPLVLSSPRGFCYMGMNCGILQLYFLRESRWKKMLTPISVGAIVTLFVLFWMY